MANDWKPKFLNNNVSFNACMHVETNKIAV